MVEDQASSKTNKLLSPPEKKIKTPSQEASGRCVPPTQRRTKQTQTTEDQIREGEEHSQDDGAMMN